MSTVAHMTPRMSSCGEKGLVLATAFPGIHVSDRTGIFRGPQGSHQVDVMAPFGLVCVPLLGHWGLSFLPD